MTAPSEPDPAEISSDEKRAALKAALATPSFLRATQLSSFLRFICEMEIAGRGGEITEYRIGVEAMTRPPGYSTAEDSIVRRRAGDLREKLQEVYASDLSDADVRIELPKGRYVPRFVRPSVRDPTRLGASSPAAPPAARLRSGFAGGVMTGTILTFVIAFGGGIVARWCYRPSESGRIVASPMSGRVIEAEGPTSLMSGKTTPAQCSGCSGGARVRNVGGQPGNFVEISGVVADDDGHYVVDLYYVVEGARSILASVNGGPGLEIHVVGQSWLKPDVASLVVPLRAGSNTIRFYNEKAYGPDIDRVVVR